MVDSWDLAELTVVDVKLDPPSPESRWNSELTVVSELEADFFISG